MRSSGRRLEACVRSRFRPESALTRLQLAELPPDHYPDEPGEATEHLDSAIREFREMKMQPPLERALARAQSLTNELEATVCGRLMTNGSPPPAEPSRRSCADADGTR